MEKIEEPNENGGTETNEQGFDAKSIVAEVMGAWQKEYASKPPSLTTEGQLISAVTQKLNSERASRNEKEMAELVHAFASATERLVMTEDGARRLKELLNETADSYNIEHFAV